MTSKEFPPELRADRKLLPTQLWMLTVILKDDFVTMAKTIHRRSWIEEKQNLPRF